MKKLVYKITHPFVRLSWKIFKPTMSGSRAIIVHEANVLLAKNINSKYWSLPGGKLDGRETPEECLVRELKEELNLSGLTIDFKLGMYASEKEGKKDTIHIFVITLASPDFQKQWELEDARWFPLEQLPSDISPAGLRRINEYRSGKKKIISLW